MRNDNETDNRWPVPNKTPRPLLWSGYAVFIWSIAYMLPHLYWAAGGTGGMSLLKLKTSVIEMEQFKYINWVASVILTLAGLLGLAFVYIRKPKMTRMILLGIAWAGCSVAASHGIYGIIYRILEILNVIELENGPFEPQKHSYVLTDLFLFEPWFLIEGILLGIAGWFYIAKQGGRRTWLMLCTLGIIIGLVTGLLGVKFA